MGPAWATHSLRSEYVIGKRGSTALDLSIGANLDSFPRSCGFDAAACEASCFREIDKEIYHHP